MTNSKWEKILKKARKINKKRINKRVQVQVVEEIINDDLFSRIERDHCKVKF